MQQRSWKCVNGVPKPPVPSVTNAQQPSPPRRWQIATHRQSAMRVPSFTNVVARQTRRVESMCRKQSWKREREKDSTSLLDSTVSWTEAKEKQLRWTVATEGDWIRPATNAGDLFASLGADSSGSLDWLAPQWNTKQNDSSRKSKSTPNWSRYARTRKRRRIWARCQLRSFVALRHLCKLFAQRLWHGWPRKVKMWCARTSIWCAKAWRRPTRWCKWKEMMMN